MAAHEFDIIDLSIFYAFLMTFTYRYITLPQRHRNSVQTLDKNIRYRSLPSYRIME